MFRVRRKSLLQLVIAALLVIGAAGGGVGIHHVPRAHAAAAPQTFVVLAGASGPANMDLLAFFPKDLQVHRGDKVIWLINGPHNVHLVGDKEEEPGAAEQQIVSSEVNGETLTYFNPEMTTPTIQDGASYTGGDANNGLKLGPGGPFSLVMDVPPGTYYYHCDLHEGHDPEHEGMAGTVTVVDDSTEIPSPTDVMLEAGKELGDEIGQGMAAMGAAEQQSMAPSADGTAHVKAGTMAGLASVQQFFPAVTVINAGDTVTWDVEGNVEVHTVSWPPLPEDQFGEVKPGPDNVPVFVLSPKFYQATLENGGDWKTGDYAHTGIIEAGHSFTARFPDPGVYPYVCILHPGMQGVIVVMAPDQAAQ